MKLSKKQQQIVLIVLKRGSAKSSEIYAEIRNEGAEVALVTVKRDLSKLRKLGVLAATGSGRGIRYSVSTIGKIFALIDARTYCATEPDKRYGAVRYNFDLFNAFPTDIFDQDELLLLENATAAYQKKIEGLSPTTQQKELDRLIIELSWKSSRLEGNTYTLLDTEKLILERQEAPGHDAKEARMILNHQEAFQYIHKFSNQFKKLTRQNLEELHAIIANDLSIATGIREKPVGVTGSKYRPLDNKYQVAEAVDALCAAVSTMKNPYVKALLALFGISYIQPFEDGNKRTARLMTIALLLAHHCAPISYRSIDENEYREALIVAYELNCIIPLKKIFIAQYVFATEYYSIQ
jgi:fido (protein-threonine AMPylation protein)